MIPVLNPRISSFSLAWVGVMLAGAAVMAGGPSPGAASGRSGSVYALVELTQAPTAVRYRERLPRGAFSATSAAVRHLDVVRNEQASFERAVTKVRGLREIYRLQRVYNGILYLTTPGNLATLRAMPGVRAVHIITPKQLHNANSMPFVGVPQLWGNLGLPVHGEVMKVGIIDTGVDYTHANFGGAGTPEAYTGNDPALIEAGTFPTVKVVGGWDFAGFDYDAGSEATATPVPDADPLDGDGHGSHVAGTVAGYGVLTNGTAYSGTYDLTFDPATMRIGPGAAPLADIYALKVFGDITGSTALAALAVEWAVDPNGDGDFSDRLDVVNLSLGSNYGASSDEDAVIYRNAVQAGVVIVASAGNSADVYFITGAPASTPEVLSVAASQSDRVPYAGVQVNSPAGIAGVKMAGTAGFGPAIPTPVSADVAASAPANGCAAFTNGADVAGKIALVARGDCTFKTKTLNAQNAGAIAIVITALIPGPPVGMADDPTIVTPITIPTRMVSRADGDLIRAELAVPNAVNATLDDAVQFIDTHETDSIASFSSRGPSRIGNQALLKPDIAAPGVNILSTAVGTGSESESLSGTSMASPLVAGIMTLLRQAHPTWTPGELKALAMNTAAHDVYTAPDTTNPRPKLGPGRGGAGRIDAAAAFNSGVIAFDADAPARVSVTFATTDVSLPVTEIRTVRLRNFGGSAVTFSKTILEHSAFAGGTNVTLPGAGTVSVPANGSADVSVELTADPALMTRARDATVPATRSGLPRFWLSETSGFLVFTPEDAGLPALRVPFFAALNPASQMRSEGPLDVTAGRVGTATVTLAGQGVDTLSPATPPPVGVFSLVTPFQLMHASPNGAPVGLPEGYDAAAIDNADLQYVGVTSNFPDMTAVAGSSIYFAVTTYGLWGAPAEVEFDVFIKRSSAPDWEYALFNGDLAPGDAYVTRLVDFATGAIVTQGSLNGLRPTDYYVPIFLSDAMVLPVFAASLGLTETDSQIDFQVVAFSSAFPFEVDMTPILHHDLKAPAFSSMRDATTSVGPSPPPVWSDRPGENIPISYNLDRAEATQVGGLLLIHHLNGRGTRGEVVLANGLSCATSADCTSPAQPVCDAASGICMGCVTNADCRGGELCDVFDTRTCLLNQCENPDANPCAPGWYCDPIGACIADCRSPSAVACAQHTWCSAESGLCLPAVALVVTTAEPAGLACTHGGVRIDSGLDDDNSGVLDEAEVLSTSFVCSAAPQLVAVIDEPPGANCSEGGKAIHTGTDTDGNGILDASESIAVSYVCNGLSGYDTLVVASVLAPDVACPAGGILFEVGLDQNRDGVLDSAEVTSTETVCNGEQGKTTLVTVNDEPAGLTCATGGQRIDTGLDTDGDGVLQAGEVQQTRYVCAGANGATGATGPQGAEGAEGGCGCSGNGGAPLAPLALFVMFGLTTRRRRRVR